MKGRVTFFLPKTIAASFLHLIVLLYEVRMNHNSKRQFVVILCFIFKWICRVCLLITVGEKKSFICRWFFSRINVSNMFKIVSNCFDNHHCILRYNYSLEQSDLLLLFSMPERWVFHSEWFAVVKDFFIQWIFAFVSVTKVIH